MKLSTVQLNQERAIVSATNSVDSLGDSVRELVMNSVDAIGNPADGKIEIRVKEDSLAVLDNGKGCFDHAKFTTFREPSDEANLISFEGIGMKTTFQYFRRIDLLSLDSSNNRILRISNFHVYDEAGKFDPAYEYELTTSDDPCYAGFLSELEGFTTRVSVSQPTSPETNLAIANLF